MTINKFYSEVSMFLLKENKTKWNLSVIESTVTTSIDRAICGIQNKELRCDHHYSRLDTIK